MIEKIYRCYENDSFDLLWKSVEKNRASEYSRHIHDYYEILYFVKASSDYVIENNVYPVTDGDIILIAPGKYHFLVPIADSYYERLCIHYQPGTVSDTSLLTDAYGAAEFLPKSSYPEISAIMAELLECCKAYSDSHLDTAVKCKLSELLLKTVYHASPPDNPGYALNDKISSDAIAFIADNLASIHCIDDIANALFLSKSSLQHSFKTSMKIPIMQFVRNKKIVAAKALIQEGVPLSEVAEQVGFKEYSTFFRCYKSYYGHTPKSEQ